MLPNFGKLLDLTLPYLIGTIFGIALTFFSGFLKEFFDERSRKAKHKREVARQVLKICNEASTGNYRNSPREIEHINSVLTDLEGINKDIELTMNDFINLWGRIIDASSRAGEGKRGRNHFIEMLSDIEKCRQTLITWANKIRY